MDELRRFLASHGPFDVVVGFSQGCIMATMLAGALRSEGEVPDWSLSVLFNGMPPRDKKICQSLVAPLEHPAAICIFGRADEFYQYGRPLEGIYSQCTVLEHSGGHRVPSSSSRNDDDGAQVLAAIAARINALRSSV